MMWDRKKRRKKSLQRKDMERVNREEGKEKRKIYHRNIRVKRKPKNLMERRRRESKGMRKVKKKKIVLKKSKCFIEADGG